MTTRIYINRVRITARGALYEARLDSPFGPTLIGLSPEPTLAACRALMAIGRRGHVEVWDAKRPFPRMAGDIATLAKLTVNERDRRFERYRASPWSSRISADCETELSDISESETTVFSDTRADCGARA